MNEEEYGWSIRFGDPKSGPKSPSALQKLKKAADMTGPNSEVWIAPSALNMTISVIRNIYKEVILLNKRMRQMDKKMAKVTKEMKTAEKDIKKGKTKEAVKSLKGAEKKNVKLTEIDRTKRDPMIKKCKKVMKKGKK